MKEDLQPKRIFSAVIIVAIAFIFVINWGPGSRGCETGRRVNPEAAFAAMVNGKEIPLREYNLVYSDQMSRYRAQGIPEQMVRQFGLGKQIIDQMVSAELWSQAAESHGIAPSDAELAETLRNNQQFQKDGQFDMGLYQDVLNNYYRKTIPEFEADLRRRMAAFKMQEVVSSTATVSDDEVRARFLKDGNKAQIAYVRFLPSFFADKVTAPTPAELAAFKKDHAKEIQESFDANKISYEQPEKVRARHILIKVDKRAPAALKEAAKAKIDALRKQVVEDGKDFAQVAKDNTEDLGSKPSGGDLGFNDRQAWVPEFSSAAFSLKPGEVSQPVETQFGYHLIKVEEKQPAQKKELKDVEDTIATNLLKQQKAKELARAEADKALAAAKGGKKLAELYPAEKAGEPAVKRFQTETKPEAVTTEEFSSSGGSIPNLGAAPELSAAIFGEQEPKLLDKVFTVNDGFVTVAVTGRKRPTDEAFNKEKDKLRAEALRAKEVEVRESFLKALKKDGQIKLNDEAINQAADRS